MTQPARNWPRVSIIIPVRDAERTIATTLRHLEALDYPRDLVQVIVADGGSRDRTVAMVRQWQEGRPRVHLLEVPNCASPGHARNEALRLVDGEYVLFTDGDCAPEPDWARRLVEPFLADPSIGGVGGEILTLRTEPENATESYCEQVGFLGVAGRCGRRESGYFPAPRERAPHEVNGGDHSPFFATANAAFRKAAIDEAGGGFWDEPTGEDVDLSLRILARGYRLYFAREAVVKHMHRVSLASYLKQWYGYGYGHPLLISKHGKGGLEVVVQTPRPLFLRLPGPRPGIVHLGSFHLAHVLLAGGAAAGLGALAWPALAPVAIGSLVAGTVFAAAYFSPCLRLRPLGKLFTWCKIRYLTNWAFVRGALAGARRFGGICVEPSW